MGESGKKEFVQPLLSLIEKETNFNIKTSIIDALGKLKDTRAIDYLEPLLGDGVWSIRIMAAEALKKITGKEYIYKVENIEKNIKDD